MLGRSTTVSVTELKHMCDSVRLFNLNVNITLACCFSLAYTNGIFWAKKFNK